MRSIYLVILLLLSSCCSLKQNKMTTTIEQLVAETGQDLNIGIVIEDLNTNQRVYQLHPKRNFIPASNLKLFTSFAALKLLGANYQFTTEALTNESGNVYLKFLGDPTLNFDDIHNLIKEIKLATKGKIKGDLIIDDTAYDTQQMADDEHTVGDLKFCFAAPSSITTVNRNCYIASLKPSQRIGQAGVLETDSPLPMIIHNQTVTTTKNCKLDLTYLGANQYNLSGCILPDAVPLKLQIAVQDPHLMLTKILQQLLKQEKIRLTGKIKFAKLTCTQNKVIATHTSAKLSAIIALMNKNSDNVIAALLYKQLGASFTKDIGSYESGAMAINSIFDLSNTTLYDGSGGSYSNLISPYMISNLLRSAYKDDVNFIPFFNSLAIAAVDGTLKNRFKGGALTQKLFAKTGAIKGVSSLAGYLKYDHNHYLSFVIMINGASGDLSKYKALEEKIMQNIYGLVLPLK